MFGYVNINRNELSDENKKIFFLRFLCRFTRVITADFVRN